MGLSGIMSIAEQSLEVQQDGLQVTANNLANVNTAGYTRQVAEIAEQAPFSTNQGPAGDGGVTLQQVAAIRDSVLEIRLNQETSKQSGLNAFQQQLTPVEALFNSQSGAGLGASIDAFFSALQQLSTNPASGAQRQSVITAGQTMAQTFQQVSTAISQQQSGANQAVIRDVNQANKLTAQIAQLNGQIASLQGVGQNFSALVDQRTNLTRSLAQIMDFTTSDGGNGQITLTGSGGVALVVGTNAPPLSLSPNGSVMDVVAGTTDITASITGGSLAGEIQARDVVLPGLAGQLDQLATALSAGVNAQNALGFDGNGNPGGNLFTPPTATRAAANIAMATLSPAAIAAGTTPNGGDNSNLLAMLNLQTQPIAGGLKPDDAYAAMISNIGSTLQGADTQQQSSQAVLTQLQNQRAALSGVSMDEESVQLTKFQQAYQAAARVVNIVNQLTQVALNLGQS